MIKVGQQLAIVCGSRVHEITNRIARTGGADKMKDGDAICGHVTIGGKQIRSYMMREANVLNIWLRDDAVAALGEDVVKYLDEIVDNSSMHSVNMAAGPDMQECFKENTRMIAEAVIERSGVMKEPKDHGSSFVAGVVEDFKFYAVVRWENTFIWIGSEADIKHIIGEEEFNASFNRPTA